MLKIITHPNEILRKKAKKVAISKIKNEKIQKLIDEMIEIMEKEDGVGLAAPQIGESFQIITVKNNSEILVFINPKITDQSWSKSEMEEGCLSVPGIFCKIKRPKKIRLSAFDRFGEKIKLKATGLFGRIIQHETDHLYGILIIDKQEKCEKLSQL